MLLQFQISRTLLWRLKDVNMLKMKDFTVVLVLQPNHLNHQIVRHPFRLNKVLHDWTSGYLFFSLISQISMILNRYLYWLLVVTCFIYFIIISNRWYSYQSYLNQNVSTFIEKDLSWDKLHIKFWGRMNDTTTGIFYVRQFFSINWNYSEFL